MIELWSFTYTDIQKLDRDTITRNVKDIIDVEGKQEHWDKDSVCFRISRPLFFNPFKRERVYTIQVYGRYIQIELEDSYV